MENRRLISLITPEGGLELFIEKTKVPECLENQVLVEVQAAPFNPIDLKGLLAGATLSTLKKVTDGKRFGIQGSIPNNKVSALLSRIGKALVLGREGAGVVVAAGTSAAAKRLLGKTVAVKGDGTYQKYLLIDVNSCLQIDQDLSPRQGASAFINPLTALSMLMVMRSGGHSALINTAAASNLGQMLQRLCIAEEVPLINIVRNNQQAKILSAIGAKYVLNSEDARFARTLEKYILETGATVAFDAIGGGELAGQLLNAMHEVFSDDIGNPPTLNGGLRKHLYIYGGLNPSPTVIKRSFGLDWGIEGFLLDTYLREISNTAMERLRNIVAANLTTVFVSSYEEEISMAEALNPEVLVRMSELRTGGKYLLNPSLD